LSKQTAAARPSLLPGIDIFGGYKRSEPELDGFVAGIALSLPLFDGQAAAARRYEAERRIVENELGISMARTREEIEALVQFIAEVQPSLATLTEHFDDGSPLADTMLYSYREGALSLDALLNSIQIESTALADYYEQLTTYYRNIFRLEAITGVSIISFAP
jgi:hypothetical protein